MSEELSKEWIDQLRRTLDQKDTEELIEIWQRNDRDAWSDGAFDAIRIILQERIGELPPQEFIKNNHENIDDVERDQVEEPADKYFDLDRLISTSTQSQYLAWFFLVFAGVSLVFVIYMSAQQIQSGNFMYFLPTIISSFLSILLAGFFFVFLKALSEIIYVLMDIEENTSRLVKSNEDNSTVSKSI
jgi:ABC-type multidrug transport system fused ATPase/permease subunit